MERAINTTHDTEQAALFAAAWSRLDAALTSERYDDVAEVIRRHWFDLLSGPAHELTVALERVPAHELDRRPLIVALLGRSTLTLARRRVHGLRRMGQAGAALDRPAHGMRGLDRAIIQTNQADLHRMLGRPDRARTSARTALAELEALPDAEARGNETVGGLYAQLAACLLDTGADADALDAAERALLHAQTLGDSAAPAIFATLAGLNATTGELASARENIHAARSQGRPLRQEDLVLLRLAEAMVALDELDATAAQAHLFEAEVEADSEAGVEAAIQAQAEAPPTAHWMPAILIAGMVELVGGYPGRGLARLEQSARARGPEGRTDAARRALAPLRAVLQCALGNPDAAAAILDRDAGPSVVGCIGHARLELMRGRHGAALQQLRPLSGSVMSIRQQAEASALEAAALLRFSTERRTTAVVDHLGAMLQHSRLLLPLALLPASDLLRVSAALTTGGYGELVAHGRLRSLLYDLEAEDPLTPRETAVLATLLEHPSHAAIAARLNVSVNTVKSQLRSVYRKLGVKTRDEAIAIALERHLLTERD
ncbi:MULTISPECIES: helix-turn-helix transcriptional regulator [unclassified Leifsonia]|uniref:helix-turn-helix domain-containing protein n=1 Tax=unclassified Leifsonia TaxID=2663824 RepID=UPI0008A7AD96|nr:MULTISPECIES: helix-turn-helix transcriptional regulator [unclassified Leifsonia]SEI16471.1 regulatory protein, luxR family [Leifsonia sp. CL154]SFM07182.1 regulatory protein, luxR family [Leifsonia sp. CL147]